MADEAEEKDELLLTEEHNPDDEQQDEEHSDEEKQSPEVNDEDEEEVLSFGDDAAEEKVDTPLVRRLRDEIKSRNAELAELRKGPQPKPEPIEVGVEPDLWDDGIDGDPDKLKQAIRDYDSRVAAGEAQKQTAHQSVEAEQEAWRAELNRVDQEKSQLLVKDADDAFDTVRTTLSPAQAAALVQATDEGNTARVIYALGKHPEKLAEIADLQITDGKSLAKFVKAVTKLEGQLKVVKRRASPQPERVERGSAPISRTTDKKLERLEKEADRTGDRSELIRYRKQLKVKAS